jgi:hypothetical protein
VPEPTTPSMTSWNPARGAWETAQGSLCGHSALFSATWPTSGMTRRGECYPLPTSAPRIGASACSSLPGLPTPQARDWRATGPADLNRNSPGLPALVPALLGTPRTSSGNGVGQYEENPRGDRGRLEAQVDRLLKTPTAQLAVNGGSQHPDKRAEGRHGPTLADEVEHLLPTPTSTPYGSNQSPSPGAAVRPSLDGIAPTLFPTAAGRGGCGGMARSTGRRRGSR